MARECTDGAPLNSATFRLNGQGSKTPVNIQHEGIPFRVELMRGVSKRVDQLAYFTDLRNPTCTASFCNENHFVIRQTFACAGRAEKHLMLESALNPIH